MRSEDWLKSSRFLGARIWSLSPLGPFRSNDDQDEQQPFRPWGSLFPFRLCIAAWERCQLLPRLVSR